VTRPRLLGSICLAAIGLFAFWPLFFATFYHDDWHFFALFRHIDSYAALVNTNVAASYFYRPIGLLFSALTFELFDLNGPAHFATNVLLHVWVCVNITQLARICGASNFAALACASLFFFCPIAAAVPTWTANRFDLIATGATLAALISTIRWIETSRSSAAIATYVWLVVAIGAKEIGLIAAAGCSLLMLLCATQRRLLHTAAICALVAAALWLRLQVLGTLMDPWLAKQPSAQLPGSLFAQLNAIAYAIGEISVQLAIVFCAFLVAIASAYFRRTILGYRLTESTKEIAQSTNESLGHRETMLVLTAMIVGVLLVQSAVAGTVFSEHPERAVGSSLRFFYLPFALLFAIVGSLASLPSSRQVDSFVGYFMLLIACVIFAVKTRGYNEQVESGARERNALVQKTLALMKQSANNVANAPCIVDAKLHGISTQDTALDLAAKAHLQRGDPAVNCVLVTQPAQYLSITRLSPCTRESFGSSIVSEPDIPPLLRSGTCSYILPKAAN
jgi:hypothetical protein